MQGRQQGNGENGLDFLWGIVALAVAIFIIWYFYHYQIVKFVYQIKHYEINAISFVLNGWNLLAHKAGLPEIDMAQLQRLQQRIATNRLPTDFKSIKTSATIVGRYLSIPFAVILVGLAFVVYGKNVTLKLRHVFNMKTMKELEQKENPQISPVIKLNLTKEHVNEGEWAMAMTPMQFSKNMKLLKEKKDENGKVRGELLRAEAQQAFVLQLGPLWTGVEALPMHAKALFAAFAAAGNQDRASGMKLLQQISNSAFEGELNFAGARELLAKHKDSKLVRKILSKHAYVLTIFATMLELARTDGVFASSEFLWLKPLNRRLWYVLNNVGRQTAVPEVGGIHAHWIAEKKWGGALRTPMVEEAVKGLEIALAEIIYEPEEQE